MNYEKWLKEVPRDILDDDVWQLKAYRASLFLSDLCWQDTSLIRDKKFYSLGNQLYSSVGSISANITEGYSRNFDKEKARFYEYSLGSARESKDWYFKSRHILGQELSNRRIKLLTSVIKLLITMIKDKRSL